LFFFNKRKWGDLVLDLPSFSISLTISFRYCTYFFSGTEQKIGFLQVGVTVPYKNSQIIKLGSFYPTSFPWHPLRRIKALLQRCISAPVDGREQKAPAGFACFTIIISSKYKNELFNLKNVSLCQSKTSLFIYWIKFNEKQNSKKNCSIHTLLYCFEIYNTGADDGQYQRNYFSEKQSTGINRSQYHAVRHQFFNYGRLNRKFQNNGHSC